MAIKLTPIATMALLLAGQAYAAGGSAGDNGSGSEIRNKNVGPAGSSGVTANGTDGASFTTSETIDSVSSATPNAGKDGGPPTSGQGGGGAGGNGGGSVIGAISTGGAGGSSSSSSANGGNGGLSAQTR